MSFSAKPRRNARAWAQGAASAAPDNGACNGEAANLPRPRSASMGRRIRSWFVSGEAAVLYVLYVLYVLLCCLFGTSQTCRGCRGNWKLGSLEAWRLGFLGGAPPHTLQLLRRALVARSVLRSLFSVLRGGISRPSPAGVLCDFSIHAGSPACASTPLICVTKGLPSKATEQSAVPLC